MDANKISEIMKEYNEGKLTQMQAILKLIMEAGCDSVGVMAVFQIYAKRHFLEFFS